MENSENLDIQVKNLYFVLNRPANPNWVLKPKENKDWYALSYAVSGAVQYRFGEETVSVKKGNIVFIKTDQRYSAKSDPKDPWHFISVAFSLECMDVESKRILHSLPNVFTASDSSRMAENFTELHRIWSAKEPGYLIKGRSLILDILYILLSDGSRRQKTSTHYAKIARVVDLMRSQCEQTYSLSELCAMTGLSPSYFRQLFKEMTGMSAIQFQNQQKIQRAKDLLLSQNCNVTEAAAAVGFSDIYYFSRMFRKLTGKNPSEYLHSVR